MTAGVFVLNKPMGMTSQQAVTRVKRLLGCQKAGHSGILDPNVTGVLPVFLGRATRLAEYICDDRKSYEAMAVFGTATDTQDATGKTIANGDPRGLTEETVRRALAKFVGTQMQTPPAYSALKVAGVRAYELARKGQDVRLAPRQVEILRIDIIDICLSEDLSSVRFHVECGKGTYIRTLCHDLGELVGVPTHMGSLVRTRSGPFSLEDAHDLTELEAKGCELLLPMASAVPFMAKIAPDQEQLKRIGHGAAIMCAGEQIESRGNARIQLVPGQRVRVHDDSGELCAIYAMAGSLPNGYLLEPVKVLIQSEG